MSCVLRSVEGMPRPAEENGLIVLRKDNVRPKMEVDILNQVALIIGRKKMSSNDILTNTHYQ